ncbi:MAG: superoxide dismutase [Bacteroidales bacterium]|jgi:Fe-Mn family superoxide dismutase|nr:superoxide dismutase [Bacteroidales bacterium]
MKKSLLLLILIAVFTVESSYSQELKKLSEAKTLSASKIVEHSFNPLPYSYDALEKAIDSETMNIHYNKHFRGYYDNFLKAIENSELQSMTLIEIFGNVSKYSTAVRNNAGGYYNHDLFWQIMSPDGGGQPKGELAKAIDKTFGTFDAFKEKFENAAATRFGSGWAWLAIDNQGKLFISSTPNQDNPLMDLAEQQGTPILGLDVWEHAYYLRYQNMRKSYIGNFWQVVNWDEVAKRFEEATSK